MSLISSIEVKGEFVKYENLFDYLFFLRSQIVFEGDLIIGIQDGIDIDINYISVENKSEDELLKYLKAQNNLASIYIGVRINGEMHYFTFFINTDSIIYFTIDGNRVLLNDRYTDFSWYYNNLIVKFVNDGLRIDSIVYEDIDN